MRTNDFFHFPPFKYMIATRGADVPNYQERYQAPNLDQYEILSAGFLNPGVLANLSLSNIRSR